jgi:serine/threonine protein kinase
MLKLQGYKNLVMAAQGVFWTMYEGINTRTNAHLWLQVFDEFTTDDPVLRQQIIALVNETTRLQHPNILAPLTIEEHENQLVLLYTPFNGQSAYDMITAQIPISESKAASAVKQAASALQFARICGVNHGLFCSEFLFLSRISDDAKVLGFGFDRLYYRLYDLQHPGISRYLAYVPPEKLSSQRPPEPDDVYALGLVSYEMLTGNLLFANLSLTDTKRQKQFPLPAPKQMNPKLSQHVSDLTMDLINPNPALRANYNAVLDLLEPQNNNVSPQEESADTAGFDFASFKRAAGKIRLPANLVGSKKRMVNILFFAAVVFILLISVRLISHSSKSDEKRLQAAYKEFVAENQHAAEPTTVAVPPADFANSSNGATEIPSQPAPVETAVPSPKTETAPAVREEKPVRANETARTLIFERPAFADQIRLDADATPMPLPAQATLTLGRHTVTFIDSNSRFTWQTTMDVQEASPAAVVIDPAQVGSGEFLVVLKNPNEYGYVFVSIDDQKEQHATPFRSQLYAGRHRIRIYRENLTVSPSDTVVFILPNEKTAIEATVF